MAADTNITARTCSAFVCVLLASSGCGGSTVESPDEGRDTSPRQDASTPPRDAGDAAHDAGMVAEADARDVDGASDGGLVNCANPHPVVTCGHPCSVPGYTCNPDPSGPARTDAGPGTPVLSWACSPGDGGGYVWVCFH